MLTDLLWAVALVVALTILSTGGGAFVVFGRAVSALRAHNALTVVLVLAPLRWVLASEVPFLLVPSLDLRRLPGLAAAWTQAVFDWLSRADAGQARRALMIAVAASFVLKAAIAWHYYGFAHGDAVEIHVLTFSALLGHDLGVWDIRNPFYPLVFIWPAQWACRHLGVTDPAHLIFAGRLVVIAFSLLNLGLVYRLGIQLFGTRAIGLVAAFGLAASQLHVRLGSTELPRTVSTTFLLLAYLLLIRRRGAGAAALAGVAFGIGVALRLGEAVLVAPLVLHLVAERRKRDLVAMLTAAGLVCLLILGPADRLWWPESFFSLRNMVSFAIVRRLSSSGYQPIWAYLRIVPAAASLSAIALFVYASLRVRLPGRLLLWTWLPVLLLSLFQHKDERYLLPLLPFFILAVAGGLWQLLERAQGRPPGVRHLLLAYLAAAFVLGEADGYRRRGLEPAIDVARYLAALPGISDVAMEDGTTVTGANLYLAEKAAMTNIDPARLDEGDLFAALLRRPEAEWVVLRDRTLRRSDRVALLKDSGFDEVQAPSLDPGDYRLFRRER